MKSAKVSYTVETATRKDITAFLEKWHYSHNINGVISDYCFAMRDGKKMVGAAIFGRMAMLGQWKRFGESAKDVIELRRLCCTDKAVRNCESYFVARMLKWVAKNTEHKVCVSYADAEYGHSGTIYRASNFVYEGFRAGARVIDWNGKHYHDKTVRTTYKGTLKPYAKLVRDALESGEATYKTTLGKHCFVYTLDKKCRTAINAKATPLPTPKTIVKKRVAISVLPVGVCELTYRKISRPVGIWEFLN